MNILDFIFGRKALKDAAQYGGPQQAPPQGQPTPAIDVGALAQEQAARKGLLAPALSAAPPAATPPNPLAREGPGYGLLDEETIKRLLWEAIQGRKATKPPLR